jgi:hypothetical protein
VHQVVSREQPDVLVRLALKRYKDRYADKHTQFTASMWTADEAQKIHAEAKEIMGPQLKTFALPQGLQVNGGPDAVVAYIEENLPALLEG